MLGNRLRRRPNIKTSMVRLIIVQSLMIELRHSAQPRIMSGDLGAVVKARVRPTLWDSGNDSIFRGALVTER